LADRKAFLLRLDPKLHTAIERWAADELRSVNGQMEYLLRRALSAAGRLPGNVRKARATAETSEESDG
jgi:hypothetical protein